MAINDYIITYRTLVDSDHGSTTPCLEFIDGKWYRTERNIVGERVGEPLPGLGDNPNTYNALVKYFSLQLMGKQVFTKEEIETIEPSKLENLSNLFINQMTEIETRSLSF